MENTLSQRLKELRLLAGYNQDYVASFLKIARQTYAHYEKGDRKPKADMLYKLAGLYNLSVEDIMHLCIDLDNNEYYDAPAQTESSQELSEFLEYINTKENKKKYQYLSSNEKELIFLYSKLSATDKQDIIDFIRVKVKRKK